jgi:NodT family efflux transporter outer membrane factor (OMF) lipoprotein
MRMKYSTALASGLCLVALSACAQWQDIKQSLYPSITAPAEINDKGASIIPDSQHWWEAFHDPLMNQLAEKLVAQNLDISIARSRIDEARGVEQVARAGLFPEVSVSGLLDRSNRQIGMTRPATIANGGLDAAWEVDLFGRTRAQISAEHARAQASDASAEDITHSVIAELMQSIIRWREAKQTMAITEAIVKTYDTQIAILTSSTQAGLSDSSALTRAQADRERVKAELALANASMNAAHYEMERLLGVDKDTLTDLLCKTDADAGDTPSAEAMLYTSIDVIRARPDVQVAKEQMLASEANLKEAEANLWPRLTLSGFFGVQHTSSQVIAADNPIWSLASGLTMPLLNFGKLDAAIDVAEARQKQAMLQYKNTVLLAVQETNTALSDYLQNMNAEQAQLRVIAQQKNTVALARERYNHGLTDMLALNTEQVGLDNARIDLLQRNAATKTAYVRLHKALASFAVAPTTP